MSERSFWPLYVKRVVPVTGTQFIYAFGGAYSIGSPRSARFRELIPLCNVGSERPLCESGVPNSVLMSPRFRVTSRGVTIRSGLISPIRRSYGGGLPSIWYHENVVSSQASTVLVRICSDQEIDAA